MKIVKNKSGSPCIYLRYYNDELYYIGECIDELNGRPYRNEEHNPWEKCRILKASSDTKRRRWWEAWLIVKLKPKNQNVAQYQGLISNKKIDKKEVKESRLTLINELRTKNNRERAIYWYSQAKESVDKISIYKKHLKTSISCMKIFLEDAKKEKRERQYENNT